MPPVPTSRKPTTVIVPLVWVSVPLPVLPTPSCSWISIVAPLLYAKRAGLRLGLSVPNFSESSRLPPLGLAPLNTNNSPGATMSTDHAPVLPALNSRSRRR